MRIKLEELKKQFKIIKETQVKVKYIFNILENILLKLKETYIEFIKNNKETLFIFGLDSFQFQSKLIDIEYEDMKRLFLSINNRMYCEYYKLYKIIEEYVKENITDKKTIEIIKIPKNFIVYNDLEPYKQYEFEMIQEIHENIILLLYEIDDFVINKDNDLHQHKIKQESGFNINNFVSTFNYNIIMVREKGTLFISYIEFFHNLHTKYLQRFTMKINLLYNHVIHDIKFEDAYQNKDSNKNDLINNFKTDNVDKTLIKEIKSSFYDTDSSKSNSPKKVKSNIKKEGYDINEIHNDNKCLKSLDSIEDLSIDNNMQDINSSNDNTVDNSKNIIKNKFKNNVKKIMNIIKLFNDKNPDISGLKELTPFDNIISFDTDIVDNNMKILTEDDKNIINRLSVEDIFMEITNQRREVSYKQIDENESNDNASNDNASNDNASNDNTDNQIKEDDNNNIYLKIETDKIIIEDDTKIVEEKDDKLQNNVTKKKKKKKKKH